LLSRLLPPNVNHSKLSDFRSSTFDLRTRNSESLSALADDSLHLLAFDTFTKFPFSDSVFIHFGSRILAVSSTIAFLEFMLLIKVYASVKDCDLGPMSFPNVDDGVELEELPMCMSLSVEGSKVLEDRNYQRACTHLISAAFLHCTSSKEAEGKDFLLCDYAPAMMQRCCEPMKRYLCCCRGPAGRNRWMFTDTSGTAIPNAVMVFKEVDRILCQIYYSFSREPWNQRITTEVQPS